MDGETARIRAADQQLLDAMWDFAAPEVSEERFRDASDDDSFDAHHRAVMATQLARALGLQSKFEEADAVLDALEQTGAEPAAGAHSAPASETAPGDEPAAEPAEPAVSAAPEGEPDDAAARERDAGEVRARIELERGRILVTRGAPADGVAHFTRAVREAATADVPFVVLDALHMLALADRGHEREWAEEGLALIDRSTDRRLKRWGVALHNNLGWTLHESGDAAGALEQFEAALSFANEHGSAEQRHVARWAVGRCLRTLGRDDEALAIQRELAEQRPDDQFVQDEIAALTGTEPQAGE
ncbi:hypothetical protein ARHIZOSPH14_28740 [Agromyces rhizosphaerae]|uniref:Tetratricopeptide repeat protein n=1 Tax=Agromyces rhizosphaerae TaxID=88374 RepID=A0A9W6CXU8_9MICO|nr:hypothetical protein [Agromyces rhizosphaerae]GLI28632.1 hypothetical protein ARHIZOSPH14_28740 [Agromyces rhizosphaerae]